MSTNPKETTGIEIGITGRPARRAPLSKPRDRRAIPSRAATAGTATTPATEQAIVAVAPTSAKGAAALDVGHDTWNGADLVLPQHAGMPSDVDSVPLPPGEAPTDADAEPTLSPAMAAAFARFRNSQLASRSSRVALAMAQLMRIRLPYPRQIEAMAELEEIRLLGLAMRGQQQLGLTIFERTGCGKSTVAEQYKLMRKSVAAPGKHPVLHARLGVSGSARDLWVAVMSELGDGFATSGTEHTLRRRAIRSMEDAGVELLVIDETHHGGNKSGFGNEITAELKIMLDTGRVPVVLLGTEAAVPIIARDRELSGRLFSPCHLGPLDWTDDDDMELWTGFLAALDKQMVADGIVTASAGLAKVKIAQALCEICGGVIGQVMRVMLMALRETVRDGRNFLSMEDLATAVDQWSLEHGFAKTNLLRAI